MKKAFRVRSAKTISAVLAAALTLTLIPKIAGSNTVLAASGSKNQDNTSLGVSAIVNPTPPKNEFSPWTGSFVYFGKLAPLSSSGFCRRIQMLIQNQRPYSLTVM